MTSTYYAHALRDALREEMAGDESVIVFGEDVGCYGGVFKVTEGLQARFGAARIRDTPIAEEAIVGLAMGASLHGIRPVAEIQFMDFIGLAMDQIVNNLSQAWYVYGEQFSLPLVVRTSVGAGANATAQHSKSLEAWLCHVPGVKVAMPSNAADGKGLLKSAIRDDNPVFFLEHKLLYGLRGEVPEGDVTVPIGVADVKRAGSDATLVATGRMVLEALRAANSLEQDGVSVEVVDPRTLKPLDFDTIAASVRKTGRLLVVQESWPMCSVASEIAARAAEVCFDDLEAPVKRLTGLDLPIPFSETLEPQVLPNATSIVAAVRGLLV